MQFKPLWRDGPCNRTNGDYPTWIPVGHDTIRVCAQVFGMSIQEVCDMPFDAAHYQQVNQYEGKDMNDIVACTPTPLEQVITDKANIDQFQQWMFEKPLPTGKNLDRLPLLAIGLGGEAGEAIELLKKHLRDDTPIDLQHLILELGDIVLIVSLIAKHFNVPMSEVLTASRRKIQGRIDRGTLRGSGDDR